MTAFSESTLVRVDGAELCVESIGSREDPALLLIGGAAWSMDWWERDLCELLAACGRRVVRYDLRDTGRSSAWPPGEPGYTFADLVCDAVGVLDGLGIERAHVAGLSMGGGIAQQLAAEHRDRLLSMAVICSGPAGEVEDELPESTFPPGPAEPSDWADRGAVVEYFVEAERACAGSGAFDEHRTRATAQLAFDRTRERGGCPGNHFRAEAGENASIDYSAFAGLPALVVSGSEDPMFGPAHGRALARVIPGARFVELEGVGHQLPPPQTWDRLVALLLDLGA